MFAAHNGHLACVRKLLELQADPDKVCDVGVAVGGLGGLRWAGQPAARAASRPRLGLGGACLVHLVAGVGQRAGAPACSCLHDSSGHQRGVHACSSVTTDHPGLIGNHQPPPTNQHHFPQQVDNNGYSALMIACFSDRAGVAEELLKGGAMVGWVQAAHMGVLAWAWQCALVSWGLGMERQVQGQGLGGAACGAQAARHGHH